MPQNPTKYPSVQSMVEGDGTPTQVWRTWERLVSQSVPIVGDGSPEGVVEAPQYSLYIDETDPDAPTVYRKMLPYIGTDRSKGWVDALTLSSLELDTLTVTDIYRDVASGEGDKFGTPPTGDWGWHDITGSIEVRGVRATDPAWSQISTGPFYAWQFGVGDYIWMAFHIPHDIVPGSDIHFHTHWLSDGTDTTNDVKWEFIYTYAKGHNQEAFDVTGTTISAQAASSGQYYHMVTETTGVTIPGLTEPDGIVYVRIGRVTNGATDSADGIFLITSDLHYQSTNLPTKNKAPNFYT